MEMIHISVRSETGLPLANYNVNAGCGYPLVGDYVLVLLEEQIYEAKY